MLKLWPRSLSETRLINDYAVTGSTSCSDLWEVENCANMSFLKFYICISWEVHGKRCDALAPCP